MSLRRARRCWRRRRCVSSSCSAGAAAARRSRRPWRRDARRARSGRWPGFGLKDEPAPYYIDYHVDEIGHHADGAGLGAIVEDASRPGSARCRSRCGSATTQFDSSRFVVSQGRGGFAPQGEGSAVTPLDDDYDAMRRQLWLATDAAYKRAVNVFARKKAAFQNRTSKRRPAGFLEGSAGRNRAAAPRRPAAPNRIGSQRDPRSLRGLQRPVADPPFVRCFASTETARDALLP